MRLTLGEKVLAKFQNGRVVHEESLSNAEVLKAQDYVLKGVLMYENGHFSMVGKDAATKSEECWTKYWDDFGFGLLNKGG